MVQKEVRKKTRIYAAVAVLSAIVLVTAIYSFGATPIVFPPNHTPVVSGMKTFVSNDELRNYIGNTTQGVYSYAGGPLDSQFFGSSVATPTAVPAPAAAHSRETAARNRTASSRSARREAPGVPACAKENEPSPAGTAIVVPARRPQSDIPPPACAPCGEIRLANRSAHQMLWRWARVRPKPRPGRPPSAGIHRPG